MAASVLRGQRSVSPKYLVVNTGYTSRLVPSVCGEKVDDLVCIKDMKGGGYNMGWYIHQDARVCDVCKVTDYLWKDHRDIDGVIVFRLGRVWRNGVLEVVTRDVIDELVACNYCRFYDDETFEMTYDGEFVIVNVDTRS